MDIDFDGPTVSFIIAGFIFSQLITGAIAL